MIAILLTLLHVAVCIFLILVVLLQTGKSADLAGAFGGGGSQTALGSRGAATVLTKLTTTSAVLFMVTSLSLAIVATRRAPSIMDSVEQTEPAAAAEDPAMLPPAAPPETVDTSPAATGEAAGEDAAALPPAGETGEGDEPLSGTDGTE
jgi:preprotein translocase subunit SecG